MNSKVQIIDVWGPLACFTRPEMKVERFSYPVMTPSAARGVMDAIYCKANKDTSEAEFRWQIKKIEVLNPIQYIALRRNEVKDVININDVDKWMSGKKEPEPLIADGDKESMGTDTKGRTQRQTMALKNVYYRIFAEVRVWPGKEHLLKGIEKQFERRVKHGKCFYQPYLGCREFVGYFSEPNETKVPIHPPDQDLGLILYDVFDLSTPNSNDVSPGISLFHAALKDGMLEVPDYKSAKVLKPAVEVI